MYQVIARKFRPRTFNEMIGQEALVATLKNAIRLKRIPFAYLFSGPKGTGKTSVARVLAKALNCKNRTADEEPCNECASCLEIQNGTSLDVLEIDGASHRGIDDIRKINETVTFSSLSGGYKIYLIDEVHMLTKEAFNALLKTLEEPPEKVLFLFATTEQHKVLPTILSRCQRFQLQRIRPEEIVKKLKRIAANLNVSVEDEALQLIAKRAEGGLRDAESFFDQIISFQEGKITAAVVEAVLGVPSKEILFKITQALAAGEESVLQQIAQEIYQSGFDIAYFYESLVDHFRNHLLIALKADASLLLSEMEKGRYREQASHFTKESLIAMIDALLEAQQKGRSHPLYLTTLEQLLYKLCRLVRLESVGTLVKKLHELEKRLGGASASPAPQIVPPKMQTPPPPAPRPAPTPTASITIDPTPSAEDLKGVKPAMKEPPPKPMIKPSEGPLNAKTETLLQFAAIELEGKINKN
jgi:DNA polymerase-3 subunit gamma/tau